MKQYLLTYLFLLNSLIFSFYQYGDTISIQDQLYPLNVCYGDYPDEFLRLTDFNGDMNGGYYKFIVFRITATWWGPSCAEAPLFDDLHFIFENYPIVFFENLVDLNQPYSCETWGEFGDIGIPILTYDENNDNFFNFFGNQFTWSVILSPDMVVQYSGTGTITSDIIQNILDEYELLGDQNYDGLVNILDIIQMVHFILEEEYTFIGDLNNDGGINILDIIALVDLILDN